ncbi:MAG: NTP transferase domain-containing protein [Elusimicrobia bacterium]|nr:NTP transferase domain-containing protein [Elusimicrobiota bacterium]
MTPQLVLLAGGLGTRLGGLTASTPKSLVRVAGEPFIFHQLRLLQREKIDRVILCAGHRGEDIRRTIGDGARFGLRISYCFDGDTLLGTGGALRRALSLLDESFWTLYGDSYLDVPFAPIDRHFSSQKRLGLMTVFCNNNRWVPSNILLQDGRIVRYDKAKPTLEMRHIDFGLGLLRREALAPWKDGDGFDLSELHRRLVAQGELLSFETSQRFYEIGTPEGLRETEAHILAKRRANA